MTPNRRLLYSSPPSGWLDFSPIYTFFKCVCFVSIFLILNQLQNDKICRKYVSGESDFRKEIILKRLILIYFKRVALFKNERTRGLTFFYLSNFHFWNGCGILNTGENNENHLNVVRKRFSLEELVIIFFFNLTVLQKMVPRLFGYFLISRYSNSWFSACLEVWGGLGNEKRRLKEKKF